MVKSRRKKDAFTVNLFAVGELGDYVTLPVGNSNKESAASSRQDDGGFLLDEHEQACWSGAEEFFHIENDSKNGRDSEQWDKPQLVDTSMESEALETSFDSGRSFYTPEEGMCANSASPARSFGSRSSRSEQSEALHDSIPVVMEERLTLTFDGVHSEPVSRVIGRIYVERASRQCPPEKFYLVARDSKNQVNQWDSQGRHCQEDFDMASRLPLPRSIANHVFRVDGRAIHQQTSILEYVCSSKLKPVPLLLKTKFQHEHGRSKLNIRIRANPSNTETLNRLIVMVVLPPGTEGGNLTANGGFWDEVKRSITWAKGSLIPGASIDIQAVFDNKAVANTGFPILLQCKGGENLFSRVHIQCFKSENSAGPMPLNVQKKTSLLYRNF